jgi:hypothetical protein
MLRTYAQRSPLLLVASLLLLALGLCLNLWWTAYDGFYLVSWLFNLTPGLVLLLTGYLVSRARRQRWLWRSLGVLLTLLLTVFVAFINVFGYAFIEATKPITDLEQYAGVRSRFGDADYVQHFPLDIPPEAIEAQLYYQPGSFQGGMTLQLRLVLPEEAWRRVEAEYKPQTQYQFSAEDVNSQEFELPVAVPRWQFSHADTTQFPNTYTILVLSTPEDLIFSYGVALDATSSEVIYWAKDTD